MSEIYLWKFTRESDGKVDWGMTPDDLISAFDNPYWETTIVSIEVVE